MPWVDQRDTLIWMSFVVHILHFWSSVHSTAISNFLTNLGLQLENNPLHNKLPDCYHIVVRYKSNEEYVYIRGRGRGKYICEECGIRCKKPSMLKKHIRTHTDVRPYHCNYCNFSFKTKGRGTCHSQLFFFIFFPTFLKLFF